MGSDLIGNAGLKFFSRMNASISHELKNTLAIIKENSGLLDDYIGMMAKGVHVEPQRFQTVARRIETQTVRADAIIKNLNQLAHLIDVPSKPVDLNEISTLLVLLHNRPAAMRQVTLAPCLAASPVMITTAPFILLNALGLALDFAFNAVVPGQSMSVIVGNVETELSICFGELTSLCDMGAIDYPAAHDKALLTALGAEARVEKEMGRIMIVLPRKQHP
jgi:signal transduction histidine kinase